MEKRFQLTLQEIYDKKFNVDFKGYTPLEVDQFLDLVIQDYEQYDKMIKSLGDTIHTYEKESKELIARIHELEAQLNQEKQKPASIDNVDLIKRITRLENAVFSNKEN